MRKVLIFIRDAVLGIIALGLFGALLSLFLVTVREEGYRNREYMAGVYKTSAVSLPPDESAGEGVGRIEVYIEGEGEPPEWYRPDEEMAAEWYGATDIYVGNKFDRDSNVPVKTTEPGCYFGWDGRTAAEWEMDLFARIIYLEFLGCSQECCEAGVDSVLRLWESEYFGKTLGETLTATAENGALVYTTYGYVWNVHYDPDGLAWCRRLCEERFASGPVWIAPFFQLQFYPSWAQPCYEIGGVYFSTFKH